MRCILLLACLISSLNITHVLAINIQPQLVASGFDSPILLLSPNDISDRLFVVEQTGQIKIMDSGGGVLPTPFLDIGPAGLNLTTGQDEQGLLGMAFHPNYYSNGVFYISYTRASDGASVISRFSANPPVSNVADTTETILFGPLVQPQANHNGGMIAFGPDGYLYIALGDGGNGGDTGSGHTAGIGNAQDRTNVLGDLLRIDINTPSPPLQYSIPPSNPFVGNGNGWREEIYAYGLRNPWRFSFDRANGRLFLGDVGQETIEEIDIITNGGNYGWRRMEGTQCYNPASGCQTGSLQLPIYEYDHSMGCSVTGGYVYRGTEFPALNGFYFYADYCRGIIWTLQETSPGAWTSVQRIDNPFNISSFGEDRGGELYICAHSSSTIYKITDTDPQPTPTPLPNRTQSWILYE